MVYRQRHGRNVLSFYFWVRVHVRPQAAVHCECSLSSNLFPAWDDEAVQEEVVRIWGRGYMQEGRGVLRGRVVRGDRPA